MAELSNTEKLRILEVRATPNETGKRKSWEQVAEETHHSKATVLEVHQWFQLLSWDAVRMLPVEIQRLRNDYVEHLEHAVTSDRPEVMVTKVGPVPDQPTWYEHDLGKMPTSVSVTPTDLGTPAPIIVGSVTERHIQLRSQPNCSGAIAQIRLEYDSKVGSVPWLRAADPGGVSLRRPGTWTPGSRADRQ